MAMIPDKFGLRIQVDRFLYEDGPALESYYSEVWHDYLRQAGGEPAEFPNIRVIGHVKIYMGHQLLFGEDESDWDSILIFITGSALRPEEIPAGTTIASGRMYDSDADEHIPDWDKYDDCPWTDPSSNDWNPT
jgi:hypothetical protein